MNRRQFLGSTAASLVATSAGASVAAADSPQAPATKSAGGKPLDLLDRICIFTDHLDDFGYAYAEIAKMLKQLKVAGPDLTVRPGGFVVPERVATDLPKAVAAFRDQGLSVPMISTGLTANDPAAAKTLAAASKLGIRYFKLGYYRYGDVADWREQLDRTRTELKGLLDVSGRLGMMAGFHNHAGSFVGGALWDSWELFGSLDERQVGFYFDPAQATIEGGNHAWKLGLTRLAPRLVMVAIKDFVWEKRGDRWQTKWVPLGQGMVQWDEFFKILAKIPFSGPISLHIEYDPGGSSKVDRLEKSLAAAEHDLDFLRRGLQRTR